MIPSGDLEALRGALGTAAVVEHEPREIEGVRIGSTVTPEDGESLATALRLLDERGLAALVRSRGTRLDLGNLPSRADLLLSLERLSGIDELDVDDGVVHVGAATRLCELREAAGSAGWEPGLDAPGASSTVGGVLAAAVTGPRGLGLGAPRDQVLGLEVTLASGTRTKCGGRVVKNVTGYDLAKLYIGSLGTLGIIEGAWLRLRPRPECVRSFALRLDGEAACELGLSLARRASARAVVLLDRAWAHRLGVEVTPGTALLVAELAGHEDAVAYDREWLGLEHELEELPADTMDRIRDLQGEAPGAAGLRFRVSALATRIGAARARLVGGGAEVLTDPGRSLLYACFPVDPNAVEAVSRAMALVREAARAGGGEWLLEAAPPWARAGRDVFGDPPPTLPLLRALKQRYDPNRVLNPGRFVGGI